MTHHTTAHYLLEGLVDLGIDYLFCNLGTDHATIIEEMARWQAEGRKHPEVILCPHENVATHMAGRPPHTLRGELPGTRDNCVHFVQDPFEIASLVRPYVKWEYEVVSQRAKEGGLAA